MAPKNLTTEYRGLRFTLHQVDLEREQFLVERISDSHILASTLCSPAARESFEALVDAWINQRIGTNPPKDVHCAACDAVLIPEMRADTEYQFDNALWVSFSGGYGMFIDPFGEEDLKAVICHACAHALCDSQPWIQRLLRPHESHAHRTEDIAALLAAGHKGWDLERVDEA
jgi:hypothetical protein